MTSVARNLFLSAAALATLGLGCGSPQSPNDGGERYLIKLRVVPEIIDPKSGRVLNRTVAEWTGEGVAYGGRLRTLTSAGSRPIAMAQGGGTTYILPDSVVQQILPTMEFTPEVNPNFAAYIAESERDDTSSTVIDGISYTVIRHLGDYGEPLQLYSYRDGSMVAKAVYTWETGTGGIRATSALTWDYTNAEVVVKTTVTVTSGRVIILSGDRRSHDRGFAQTPSVVRAVSSCAERIGEALLPERLEAMTVDGGCALAWVGFGANIVGLGLASAALVVAPTPLSVVAYFWQVGNLIHATFSVGQACKRR